MISRYSAVAFIVAVAVFAPGSATAVVPSAALAAQCGESSPRLLSMGEHYFDVHPFHATTSDVNIVLGLEQIRHGSGTRTECFSRNSYRDVSNSRLHDNSPYDARVSNVSLSDIYVVNEYSRHDDGLISVVIKAYEYDDKLKRTRLNNVVIPVVDDAAPSSSNIRRRQITETGSYLRETQMNITRNGKALVIEQSIYVNGSLAEWFTWTLY